MKYHKKGEQFVLWAVSNIQFEKEFKTHVNCMGEEVVIFVTDWKGASNLQEPFKDWIQNKITSSSMHMNLVPNILECVFIFTLKPVNNKIVQVLNDSMRLSLQLIYYSPTIVSSYAQYIENAAVTVPNWHDFNSFHVVSKRVLNKKTFADLIGYVKALSDHNRDEMWHLREVVKISQLNDVLYELLLLWSFLEGFWNELDESKLDKSFLNMLLKDYSLGGSKSDPDVNNIRQKILQQNEVLGGRKYSQIRNIVAHGWFLSKQNKWSKEQWKTIYSQRDLLFETITRSLVNRVTRM